MIKKNKDYIEMRVSSTDCAFTQNAATTISIEGFSYDTFFRLPDPGESYVIISKEKFDRLLANVNINAELAKQWEINYDLLLKKTGFDTVEELVNYLDSEAECDTLHEAILKLKDQVKYTCEELYSANSTNNSWKAASECNSPKELIEKREALEQKVKILNEGLKEWKEGTGCQSPSAAKTMIESQESWCHAYHEVKKANEKLGNSIKAWQNVTGDATPEDYMHAKLNNTTPFDYTAAWQKATGCDTPDQVKSRIEGLENAIRLTKMNMLSELEHKIDEWQKATGFSTPEKCSSYIDRLEKKLEDIKNLTEED